ncbi:MAG TPA: hypothetical protein VMH36_12115 [Alphaproteobacteria bacterium]|nr:hypothetical protein [Alphaproteobacteria bacterium]
MRSDLTSPVPVVQTCATWFAEADAAIDDAGVRDGEAYPIPGFLYLRANRFLASFRTEAQRSDSAFAAWEDSLRELDARTRGYELQNLPLHALAKLGARSWQEAKAHADQCAATLRARDTDPARRHELVERAQVPDDYSDWKRTVGLYPLVRIPFFQFAKGWEGDAKKLIEETESGQNPSEPMVRYQAAGNPASAGDVAALLASVKRNALGIPEFSETEADTLFAAFAPVVDVETTGDYDRIGALQWGAHDVPEVDRSRPTIYRRLAFARYGDQTLVQVVYLLWFSERPDSSWLDPLSGRLDGLFFRVTLDPTGRPLVYDTIHPCGCYHMFFPTPLATPLPAPDQSVEWSFVPKTLPSLALPERIVIRVQSRTHYLMGIRPERSAAADGVTYALADDGLLRTLPTATGVRSIYGRDGIVRGTERGERFATWPLGLEEAGSMREWGRHATALIGRRHFDDAALIEQRFAIQPSADTHVSNR